MDADGVTGHEFYQESADGRTMERVRDNITAIVPCLHHQSALAVC